MGLWEGEDYLRIMAASEVKMTIDDHLVAPVTFHVCASTHESII